MTGKELLQHQCDDAAYQLGKVFEGIDASLDEKLTEESMTPREIAAHLSECYVAMAKEVKGDKHSWGTHTPSTTEWPALWNETMSLRTGAIEAALSSEGYEKSVSAYICAHDYYHVGQLVILRMAKESGWDPYLIYNMH